MRSPYFESNGSVSFMPPPGLAEMLAQREKDTQEELAQIGKVAGGLAGGIVGGFQGAASPGTFGAGTTSASGFGQGLMQNLASSFGSGGGGGGGGFSNFASMVQGGGMGGGVPNFKQLQHLGKSADAFREALKTGIPLAGDQEHNVFGTDDEWKTLSALDKFSRVGQAIQAQQFKAGQLGYMAGVQDYQDRLAASSAEAGFRNYAATAPILTGRGPVPTTMDDIRQAALRYPTARSAQPLIQQMARETPGMEEDVPPEQTDIGGVPYVWKRGSKEFQPRADYPIAQRQANAEELLRQKNQPVEPGEPPAVEPPAGFVWKWDGKRWIQARKTLSAAEALRELLGPGGATNAPAGNNLRSGKYKVSW